MGVLLASPCDATRHVGLDRTQKLMEERDLQTRLEEDMLPMTRSFLEAAKAINQRIGDDNKVGISLGRWLVVQAHGVLTGAVYGAAETRSGRARHGKQCG